MRIRIIDHHSVITLLDEEKQEKIKEWNQSYGYSNKGDDILFIKKLRKMNFKDAQIEKILVVLDSTCNQCWNDETGCQCWNDE